jgi:voltage-gated potassium channel Kch
LLASIWYSLGQKRNVNVGQNSEYLISGWISSLGTNLPQVTLYIASLYWTFTTLTTVGYGDIVGYTTEEYIYTMVVEVSNVS